MTLLTFTLIMFLGACLAGFIGSLSGLGGGIIIIPLLTVFLGVDIHYAIGTALVSVIATSSGAAAAFVKEGITNMRLGMFLEIGTTAGAVIGALISTNAPTSALAILFGATLIFSSLNSLRKKEDHLVLPEASSNLAIKLNLNSTYPTPSGEKVKYGMTNILGGFSMMGLAGMMSGLLGIGSGAFKVIAMDTIMKVPFKVSTTTSNFMMGVTAIASSVIYIQKGYIEPSICMPVIIGVLIGAMFGAKVLVKTNTKKLKIFFAFLILILAINMIYNGITGRI
ncbi:MAG: sulfite exporter TauE/SafE family protein [Flavobacteriaceae bacterium]|nr:sulfite exporter TauE/SafE family protein [Flavobacteriaceae bacterium]